MVNTLIKILRILQRGEKKSKKFQVEIKYVIILYHNYRHRCKEIEHSKQIQI